MNASPFDTLSGEIRNRIYHFFFQGQLATQTHIDIRDIRKKRASLKRNQSRARNALALSMVSHQLRRETLQIFWSTISLRIVSDTLSAFSYPVDKIPDVEPMNRANHINHDRAAIFKKWLETSGIARYAHLIRPIELDLGVWDPRIHAHQHQHIVLRLLQGNTQLLTDPLKKLTKPGTNVATESTLIFNVTLQPSTALGPIRVPNERKQALAAIAKLCDGRQAATRKKRADGLLTHFGYSVISNDVASCRSVAELLVGYIVQEEEKTEEDAGIKGKKGRLEGRKGQRSIN